MFIENCTMVHQQINIMKREQQVFFGMFYVSVLYSPTFLQRLYAHILFEQETERKCTLPMLI